MKKEELERENQELRQRLTEAEETLAAIRGGNVDAIIVEGLTGPQIFSVSGAETVYRLVFEAMAEAAIITTAEGVILFCNIRFVETVSVPLEQIMGRDLVEFIPLDAREAFRALLAQCARQPVRQRVQFLAEDGNLKPVLLNGNMLIQDGQVTLCLVASDLTELENSSSQIEQLRQAQAELRESRRAALNLMEDALEARGQAEQTLSALHESEQRFRLALTNAPLIVSAMDKDLRYTWTYNQRTRRNDEVVGRTDADLFPEEEHLLTPIKRQVFETGNPTRQELWLTSNGQRIYLDIYMEPLRNAAGDIIGIGIAAVNLTEKKRAEEEIRQLNESLEERVRERTAELQAVNKTLRESEERFRLIFNSSIDAIMLTAPDGTVFSANPAAHHIFGWNEEEIIKLGRAGLVDTSDPRLVLALEERARSGSFHGELTCIRKDGRTFPADLSTTLFTDQNGNVRTSMFIRDITERKEAEGKIRDQLAKLEALRSIDMAIMSSTDLKLTLRIILDQIKARLKVDAVNVLLMDSSQQYLRYAYSVGIRNLERSEIPVGEGVAGQVVAERTTIVLENPEGKDAHFTHPNFLKEEKFVYYCGVPLIVKGKVKGVLEIFNRSTLDPDHEWFGFMDTLAGQVAIAVENANLFESLERTNFELFQAYDKTIEGWSAALDLRDKETEGHTQRVTRLTVELARTMGIQDEQLIHIRRGALLHDIGKMGVPDHILLKPDKLTDEEWQVIRQHPRFAYELLKPIAYLRPALDIPYYHHEKWDGSGYPHGLKGEAIPLSARIFSIVDVWDALQSDRPYRKGWKPEKIIAYIKDLSGKQFDPQIVEIFIHLMETEHYLR